MRVVCLFLLAFVPAVAAPAAVELSRQGPLLIANAVYLNHRGPFRMLIDTGSASSSVSQAVARRIGLRPAYAVEQESPAGVKLVAATLLDEVSAGPVTREKVEALILDRPIAGLDGVLGQTWLGQSDYLIDYRARRLIFDPDPPVSGVKLALHDAAGRPSVAAQVDGREMELVLDSGAERLVLFGASSVSRSAMMFTANGTVAVGMSSARVAFGAERPRSMQAVRVNASERAALLPLASFAAVYVFHRAGLAILVLAKR